jgi:hypothetical protein
LENERAVREAFAVQEKACAALGSPFTARLMRIIGERLKPDNEVARAILSWPGDASSSADNVPLRLAGGLHALVLSDADHPLHSVYPPDQSLLSDDAVWSGVETTLEGDAAILLKWLQQAPQTNEVRRSCGIFAGLNAIAAATGATRISLLEPGASAGLNLACDRFAYRLSNEHVLGVAESQLVLAPLWKGPALTPVPFAIVARAGCDINPLDIRQPADVLRLRAYTWADQYDRLERLETAIALAKEALPEDALTQADAGEWLQAKLARRPANAATVIYHTIAWQYFPAATVARCQAAIAKAAASAKPEAPLAWLAIENDGGNGASIRLRIWPGSFNRQLGRMDFHGRWVEWRG